MSLGNTRVERVLAKMKEGGLNWGIATEKTAQRFIDVLDAALCLSPEQRSGPLVKCCCCGIDFRLGFYAPNADKMDGFLCSECKPNPNVLEDGQ